MACYRPRDAYYGTRSESGRRSIVFDRKLAVGRHSAIKLPCGRCIGCRVDKRRAIAVRATHEASLYQDNCFLTLTYDDEHLPHGCTLVKHHLQDFIKRLRERIEPRRIRHFSAGEYGENLARPHYHSLVFNWDFPDKILLRENAQGSLYTSELLSDLWPHGFHSIGAVTAQSASYVASYVMKKRFSDPDGVHYLTIDERTGELFEVEPEFQLASNGGGKCYKGKNGGLGAGWLERYSDEVWRDDAVMLGDREIKPPPYYDRVLEREDPKTYELTKERRRTLAVEQAANSTYERLAVREQCAIAKQSLKRKGQLT